MSNKTKALIGLGLTIIFFSILAIIARFIVADTPQMVVFFLRMLVAAIFFLPFFLKSQVWKKAKFINLVAVSLFSTVNVGFFLWGIKYTTASASQLIYAAQPILTILVSNLFLKEKYSRQKLFGVIIGLCGIVYIIYTSAVEKGETISGGLVGNMAVVVAMLAWLFYILFSKKFSKFFSPVEIGSTSILASFAVSFVLMCIQLSTGSSTVIFSVSLLFACLYMGFFGTFLTYLLMQYAVKYLSPLTVNLTSYVQPITTAILAIILLGEKLTLSFFFGSVMVFLGVFFTATFEFIKRKREYRINMVS